MPGAALRVVNTLESESAGITGAVDSPLDPGVDDIVSEPVDDAGVTVRVDVPVLFLGAPRIFAVPRMVTAEVGADLLARAAFRAAAGSGSRDRPSTRRSAALVRHQGPSQGKASGARGAAGESATCHKGRLNEAA